MNTIEITLSDEQLTQLHELAQRFKLPIEDIARMGVTDLLVRQDERFEQAAKRVLSKNAELYRRLS